jgi:hypothetical protein
VVYETHSQRRRGWVADLRNPGTSALDGKMANTSSRGCHNGRSRRRKMTGRATLQHELGFECGHVLLWFNGTFGVSHGSSTDSDRTLQ